MSVAITVFWNIKKYSLEERYLCLGRKYSTLKMEAAGLSEKLVLFYRTMWQHILKDSNIFAPVNFNGVPRIINEITHFAVS
jgi:hypothetical protein